MKCLLAVIEALLLSGTAAAAIVKTPSIGTSVSMRAGSAAPLIADQRDFLRQWGVMLLKQDDPTFSDPGYLQQLTAAASPATVSHYDWGPLRNKHGDLIKNEFIPGIEGNEGHTMELVRFTNSGTDANNALYELAEWAHALRTGREAKRAHLLFFGQPYGGVHGRIAEIGGRYESTLAPRDELRIPTPHLKSFKPRDEEELRRVEAVEDQAVSFIERQAAKSELEIGGIFLEPISAFNGIRVFRPEFMKRLRILADELKLPIFADEVLTGGGRTGKFFAFHHYTDHNDWDRNLIGVGNLGFTPDAVTFGKGLVASGVAGIQRRHVSEGWIAPRWDWPRWRTYFEGTKMRYPEVVLDNTSRLHPLILLQALQVIKRVREGGLVEQAAETGAYLLERLREFARRHGEDPSQAHGVGLLLHVGELEKQIPPDRRPKAYQGRWTPPLTLTREEIDAILAVD